MNFVLGIQPGAFQDMRSSRRWLAIHISEASARRWQQRAATALRRLLIRPDLNPFAHEEQWFRIGLRQVLFGKRPHVYRILFAIEGNTVKVLRIRHAAQDWLGEDDV